MESILSLDGIIALLTLTLMEIILGIDNIIFISIITGKLPQHLQAKARTSGLLLALIFRILLLLTIKWIIGLTTPIMTLPWTNNHSFELSIKDLILFAGGLFLIAKSIHEMHVKLEGTEESPHASTQHNSLYAVLGQIIVIDLIFSFDSILTAVGLSNELLIMILAVIISMLVMLSFSGRISAFINTRPTIQILALTFLVLIGFMLLIESLHQHMDKGYIYFAIGFGLLVELINSRLREKSHSPIKLKSHKIITDNENSSS